MAAGPTTIVRRLTLGAPRPMPADDLVRTAAVGAAGLLVDVREPEQFEKRHVAGAVNIPDSKTTRLVQALRQVPSATLLCNDGKVATAVCRTLGFCGFTNLFYLDGGLDAWEKAGGPLVQTTPSGTERRIVRNGEEPSTAVLCVRALSFRNLMIALAGSVTLIVATLLIAFR